MELIQSRLDGSRVKDNDKNMVKLERASAFYHPPIRETVKGSHAAPAMKAALLCRKAECAEDHLKLLNGSANNPLLYSCAGAVDGAHYSEPLVAASTGHGLQLHLNGDASNGIA